MKDDFYEKIKDSIIRQIDELTDTILCEETKKVTRCGLLSKNNEQLEYTNGMFIENKNRSDVDGGC